MHLNSQKRIYGDFVCFITCVVKDKITFFCENLFCDLWINELKFANETQQFRLYAFCLNKYHFHLLIGKGFIHLIKSQSSSKKNS